jgi:hypothetical protein
MEPATFRLVAQCPNHLRHRVPQRYHYLNKITVLENARHEMLERVSVMLGSLHKSQGDNFESNNTVIITRFYG